MTVNELCKCFKGFSDDSRVIIHYEHGESVMCKWEAACCFGYTVKRFEVSSTFEHTIVLEIWN